MTNTKRHWPIPTAAEMHKDAEDNLYHAQLEDPGNSRGKDPITAEWYRRGDDEASCYVARTGGGGFVFSTTKGYATSRYWTKSRAGMIVVLEHAGVSIADIGDVLDA